MNEIWKPVPGFASYEISNLGRIRNVKTNRIRKSSTCRSGYPLVQLHRESSRKTFRIHRLVAIAFIPNPDNLPQVNHKDGNKENNKADNLEWMTAAQNIRHFYANGGKVERKTKGSNNGQAKLTETQVLWIRKLASTFSQYELSEIFNICRTHIRQIIRREKWKHI